MASRGHPPPNPLMMEDGMDSQPYDDRHESAGPFEAPQRETLPPPGTYEITVRTFARTGAMFKATRRVRVMEFVDPEAAVSAAARSMYREMAEAVTEEMGRG